ncbi:MAG: discoidin domain-containing protein [Lachnospiraceae bacterium]|nr:discoidin domain-containing protein [Lachnospiraceae bacterium]
MQKKKKTGAFWYIILEILIGVLIAHFFLMDAFDEKHFLKAVIYAYSETGQTTETASSAGADGTVGSSNSSSEASSGTGEVSEGTVSLAEDSAASETVTITVSDVSDVSGTVSGAKVAITSASESSVVEQEGYSNTAYEAYDGDLTTSWQEGVDGAGEGSWLSYTFDGTCQVTSIVFYLGVWREAEGKDYYHNNHRPKQIEISMGGQTWTAEFTDEKIAHVVSFSSPVEASEVTFTILSVYGSEYYDDTGIAEIMVMA